MIVAIKLRTFTLTDPDLRVFRQFAQSNARSFPFVRLSLFCEGICCALNCHYEWAYENRLTQNIYLSILNTHYYCLVLDYFDWIIHVLM